MSVNQQFSLTPNNRAQEGCIITAVCQETEHTDALSTHTHSITHNHSHVVCNNLKFPETGALLGGTNQLHLKPLGEKKETHQQQNKKTVPPCSPVLCLRKSFGKGGPLDQAAYPQPRTTSTYWHFSELTEKKQQINKQRGEMLFNRGFK